MKRIMSLILSLVLILVFSGCAKEKEKDVLKIGVDDSYPPMEYRDDNNVLVGFDVDFAKALSAEIGMEIEFIPTAWDGIFVGLNENKYDCIISSVSTTTERLGNFDFTKPYLSNGIVIVVSAGNENIATVEDLEGKKVGVQTQTTAHDAANKQNELTPFSIQEYGTVVEAFLDLEIGRTDCVVVDYPVALEYVTRDPDKYVITTAQLTNEPIAICVKKGNTELRDKLDKAIKSLQESGKMKDISMQWFKEDYTSNIDTELR